MADKTNNYMSAPPLALQFFHQYFTIDGMY